MLKLCHFRFYVWSLTPPFRVIDDEMIMFLFQINTEFVEVVAFRYEDFYRVAIRRNLSSVCVCCVVLKRPRQLQESSSVVCESCFRSLQSNTCLHPQACPECFIREIRFIFRLHVKTNVNRNRSWWSWNSSSQGTKDCLVPLHFSFVFAC